jgi:hypothetical protein
MRASLAAAPALTLAVIVSVALAVTVSAPTAADPPAEATVVPASDFTPVRPPEAPPSIAPAPTAASGDAGPLRRPRVGVAAVRAAPSPTPRPRPVARASIAPQPTEARAFALARVGSAQFACLLPLWEAESRWNSTSFNRSSGAYGIPQAVPGAKMASAGADWATNPITQVRWGLGYIHGRYGSPCGAWAFWRANGWY